MTKRYALKGINDDQTVCCVCGKVELKRVMWLVELDAEGNELGDPFHCGTTCGAKLMGQKQSAVIRVVNNYEGEARRIRNNMAMAKQREKGRDEILEELSRLGLKFTERLQHPLWQKLKQIEQEAREWADAQEIIIEVK